MTDRVKYFLLGLLFLVVAGVIAFDRWNSREALQGDTKTAQENTNLGETWVNPPIDDRNGHKLTIDPNGPDGDSKLPPLPGRNGPGRNGPGRNGPGRDGRIVDPQPKPTPEVEPTPRPNVDPKPILVAGSGKTHVVQSGETLEAISRQYYPGKVHAGIKLIARANKIENLNRITERQKLVIPAMNSRSSRKAKVQPVENSRKVPHSYTVKAADGDLYSICRPYYGRAGEGRRIKEIMALNNLVSSNVTAGTVLKLPPR
jgi:LysM repeat protein